MALNPQLYRSETNTSPADDDLTPISDLPRDAGEIIVIQTLQRFIAPIFIPIFRPLIRQFVEEHIGLAKQEILVSLKENPANIATTSVMKKLALRFRNRIALPVFTGMPLLGENQTPIEIALVDVLTDQIVNTGTESNAKLEIMGFRVGDDDGNWTFEEVQRRILVERNGRRILQGNTRLQLKEGICFVDKISFTHNSEHTKNGWYRLGAIVVDSALMNGAEVAWTETFVMKDRRYTYYDKRDHPCLSDKVCHLQQISYKGPRFKHLMDAGVITVKDLLFLLYMDPERLEHILKLKASSKIWCDIVKSAQASNGMFLYLDPGKERKTGVVLDVKLQLKGLIVESHHYIPINQLSDTQKVDNQDLVKFASEHLETLRPFEDETSLTKYLILDKSLEISKITDGPPRHCSQVNCSSLGLCEAPDNLNNFNHAPTVTSQCERGKEKVPFDDEITYSMNYRQEYMSFHPSNLERPNGLNLGTTTGRYAHNYSEPDSSSQAVESLLNTSELMNTHNNFSPILEDSEEWDSIRNWVSTILSDSPNNECHYKPETITIARERWINVFKLLRRNSVRERISLSEGIQVHKKQRCC